MLSQRPRAVAHGSQPSCDPRPSMVPTAPGRLRFGSRLSGRKFELLNQLLDRRAARPNQLGHLLPEPGSTGRTRHRRIADSFRAQLIGCRRNPGQVHARPPKSDEKSMRTPSRADEFKGPMCLSTNGPLHVIVPHSQLQPGSRYMTEHGSLGQDLPGRSKRTSGEAQRCASETNGAIACSVAGV